VRTYCTNQQGGTNEHERLEKMQRIMEHFIGKNPKKLRIGNNFFLPQWALLELLQQGGRA
jgi:hypothetical protein